MASRLIRIGKHRIGDGHPCFIIAEAGSNHNGRLEQARQLIDVAAEAGVDAVKFQLFRADKLYPRSAGVSRYLQSSKPIYDLIAALEMPYAWLPALAAHCQQRAVTFLASAFDEESADRLAPYVAAFKIASYEMTHLPLVRHVASKGQPLIISTGTADLDEVAETVQVVRDTGNEALALMQCTAAYPAPLAALQLRAIPAMRARFDVPVGFSDHSREPSLAPVAAVALGAHLLEKHITLSNHLPGPDHGFAVEPAELRLMVQQVREVEQALGSPVKLPHPAEAELRAFARRSIFTKRAIRAGETLTPENLAVLRCGVLPAGLEPKYFTDVIGKHAQHDLPVDHAIQRTDCR